MKELYGPTTRFLFMEIKKNKRIITAIVAAIIIMLVIINSTYKSREHGLAQQIEELRKKTQPQFDSISFVINEENNFHNKIISLIEAKNLDLADKLVDSSIQNNPTRHIIYTYKGMIYAARNNYTTAIEQFNKSMSMAGEFPLALAQRAQSYLKLKHYEKAIADLKKAANFNYDYNLDVGLTYEQLNVIDSAIVYYEKYLVYYPQKVKVKEHINSLTYSKE